ncbi:hypothetical protein GCM10029964_082680 [Kibdelosporangium lantanae]
MTTNVGHQGWIIFGLRRGPAHGVVEDGEHAEGSGWDAREGSADRVFFVCNRSALDAVLPAWWFSDVSQLSA